MIRGLRQCVGTLIAVLTSASAVAAQNDPAITRDVDLDHIIVFVSSLKAGIAEFAARAGVTAVIGGQHPGRGTENALASLGPGRYVELLAPVVPAAAADSAPGGQKLDLRLVGWAVHTRALPQLIDRVKAAGFKMSGPDSGSRRKPDGTVLEWRTAALGQGDIPLAPFVIEWGGGAAHPSATSPGGCRLVRMVLETPDSTRLQRFMTAVGHAVTIRTGPTDRTQVELACPNGTVTLTS